MRNKLLAIAIVTVVNASAQTKTIKNRDKDKGVVEEYTVQKSAPLVREGPVKIRSGLYPSQNLVTGYYHQDQKDSLWMFFNGSQMVAEGKYNEGSKTGVWLGFSKEGLRLRFNYSTNELLYYSPAALDTAVSFKATFPNGDTKLDRVPISFGGVPAVLNGLSRYIRYPLSALQNNRQGGIILTFTIDDKGIAGNYRIKNSPADDISEAVIKAAKVAVGEWLPGIINGKPVSVDCEIPILFLINPSENAPTAGYLVVIIAGSSVSVR